jgi:GTPase
VTIQEKTLKISIIGRPNVGKSTLVNRLAEKKICIVGAESGITRDRKYVDFEWEGRPITIIDTGGLTFDEANFASEILKQARAGIEDADSVIFLVDVSSGLDPLDYQINLFLKKHFKKPIYLAVNKVDSPEREVLIYEFYKLGFDKVYPISALHGSQGLSELLSEMADSFYGDKQPHQEENAETIIKVAFVGKPNVGKSSLFNKLLGNDRSIVSDISGTTRDSINIKITRHAQRFELIDTAGLRRKSKVKEGIEKFSNIKTTRSIVESDTCVLILDATEEEIVTEQDQKIASLIETKGKSCVVLINKWDILNPEIKEDPHKLEKYKEALNYKLRFISYAPIEYISAISGQRTDRVWELIKNTHESYSKRINTNLLNKMLGEILSINPPPLVKQKAIKIKYITQIGTKPPEFLFFANYPELVPESYLRFLEKQFRQYFGFEGTPIKMRFKEKE